MKKLKLNLPILVTTLLLAWPLAYGPVLYQRHQAFEALEAPTTRTACLLSADVVGYDYDGITTRPYILLDGKRYYNNDFRRWNTAVGRILLVTDSRGHQKWTRLSRDEATQVSGRYGISSKACRRLLPETVEARANSGQQGVLLSAVPYPGPASTNFWEKAIGRAAQPPATRKHLP